MQREYLEHQWQGSATQPEWLNDLFDTFHAWHVVGSLARPGRIGLYKIDGVQFADLGDWIIANTDGTYSVVKDEDHVPL
jgi:hypothetical protein